jgi:dephospho-CoA kinase
MRSLIGITGAFGSGKTTAAQYLEDKGYTVVVLSKPLEEEAIKRKLPMTRKTLQDIGNEWREKYGSGILMQKALEKVKNKNKIVIDGLRNFGEVEILKENKGILLAIVADRSVRFERLKKLKRREKLTKSLFHKLDLRDLGVDEKITGLQTAICIALADVYIDSNSGIDDFKLKIEAFLKKYGKQ